MGKLTDLSLHDRISEHLRAANNPSSYPYNALAQHYARNHDSTQAKFEVNIIDHKQSTIKRKLSEALYIYRNKPELNEKSELYRTYCKIHIRIIFEFYFLISILYTFCALLLIPHLLLDRTQYTPMAMYIYSVFSFIFIVCNQFIVIPSLFSFSLIIYYI